MSQSVRQNQKGGYKVPVGITETSEGRGKPAAGQGRQVRGARDKGTEEEDPRVDLLST